MGIVDDFLLGGNDQVDSDLGTKTMVCNGQTFAVVWNDAREGVDGEVGGLEPNVQAMATAQPRHVTSPPAMLNKRCTVAGVAYRVSEVTTGDIAIHFTLIDPNESR